MHRTLMAPIAGVAIAAIAIGAVSASNARTPAATPAAAPASSTPAAVAANAAASAVAANAAASAVTPASTIPVFDPGNFTPGAAIDNVYFPLPVGRTLVYKGMKVGVSQRDVVHVTTRTKMIDGVLARGVSDIAKHRRRLLEKTTDWYAQDNAGNVWYLGEDTVEFKPGGKQDTSGSWMAGVGGAVPGIIMLADPRIPDAYRQEYWKGQAEDTAWVVVRGGTTVVPFGTVHHVLRTLEASRLEPRAYDLKIYGPGLGIIREKALSGDPETANLVRVIEP